MISIAIDGPSGAGKSTLAQAAAKQLGFIYIDTGAMYRTVALAVLRAGIDPKNGEAVKEVLPNVEITLSHVDGEQHIFLCGEDVSEAIRANEISAASSDVSAIPAVRGFLLELQRSLARENNVIMDGRDIGTVILPEAQVKIFLTASPQDRARRRYKELMRRGMPVDYDDLLSEMVHRDEQDANRAIAPLRQAHDAVRLDTSGLEFEQSLEKILNLIKEKLA